MLGQRKQTLNTRKIFLIILSCSNQAAKGSCIFMELYYLISFIQLLYTLVCLNELQFTREYYNC